MRSLGALVRRCEAAFIVSHESPQRTAAAFAIGVAISFSPLLGLQIALAACIAWVWRLNRVLLFVGLCTNLPWLMAPYYAATTEGAAWLMGTPAPSQLVTHLAEVFAHSVLSRLFWVELGTLLWPLFWPFVIGSSVTAALLGLVAYRVGLAIATARRAGVAEAWPR